MFIIKVANRYHRESQILELLDKDFKATLNIFKEIYETQYLKTCRKLGTVLHTCILLFTPVMETAVRDILSLRSA